MQSAVSMLSDHVKSGSRSTRRVAILLTLLGDDDETKGMLFLYIFLLQHFQCSSFYPSLGEFLQTLKKRLHSLLVIHDGNTLSSIKSNWVLKEASNIDALQEGGTFR